MITIELLKSLNPCKEGFKKFCELFPHGADLKIAADGLAEAGHSEWGLWLYNRCRENKLFDNVTINGYQNTGDWNTGNRNTGNRNTGDQNTGYRNTGHQNTGDQNTGHWNTGNRNTGNWNTGNRNTGAFNTVTPSDILVFNKLCSRNVFDSAYKSNFLFFDLTYWVSDTDMTDDEKAADPNFYARGGQLRKKDYKKAFKESWDSADINDRERVRDLPNFDAQIFFEISGIDLR